MYLRGTDYSVTCKRNRLSNHWQIKELRLEETEEMEDEFASAEERCLFMKICLCYDDDAKREHFTSIIRFLKENQSNLNNH